MPVLGYQSGCLGSVWSPAAFGSDLVAWYTTRAGVYSDAGVTRAVVGDSVRQWNDQSGNGNHLSQATAGQRPLLNGTSLPGRLSLNFQAVNSQELVSATNAVALSGTQVSAWFAGANLISADSNGRLASYLATGQTNDDDNAASAALWYRDALTTNVGARRNGSSIGLTGVTGSTNFWYGVSFDGSNGIVYGSGNSNASSGSFGPVGTLRLGVGTGGQHWDGYLSEALFFKRSFVRPSADYDLLWNYLQYSSGL